MYQAILFDLDGVLVDTYEVWYQLLNEVARHHGYDPIPPEAYRQSWGQGIEVDVKLYYRRHSIEQIRQEYARYYGVGGGKPSTGLWGKDPGRKLFDVDSDFDDQDHEWYDHGTDPLELVNLANDRSRRSELRGLFERLRVYEAEEMEPAP